MPVGNYTSCGSCNSTMPVPDNWISTNGNWQESSTITTCPKCGKEWIIKFKDIPLLTEVIHNYPNPKILLKHP